MTDPADLPPTAAESAAEIARLKKRIETLEGEKGVSAKELSDAKAELEKAKADAAAAAKPAERKRDKWGWPIE